MVALANCQAVGCFTHIKRGQFLCRPHWLALPLPLRRQVNATWGVRKRAMREDIRNTQAIIDHVEACDEARRWTAEGEGQLAAYRPDADRIQRLYARNATDRATSAGED